MLVLFHSTKQTLSLMLDESLAMANVSFKLFDLKAT